MNCIVEEQLSSYHYELDGSIEQRCLALAKHIINTGHTVRATAEIYGVCKSTVHKDVTFRLKEINPQMHLMVKTVLEQNKNERHLRGGMATKAKYKQLHSSSK